MKKTFAQIAQKYINNQALTDSDIRAVLHWFGGCSLYFPDKQNINNALQAFVWLYQHVCHVTSNSSIQEECASLFAQKFSLSSETAYRLYDNFLQKTNTAMPTVIGIEGLDGSGKTVQAEKLCIALRKEGKSVYMIDFPQYKSFFGKEIGQLLSGTDATSAMNLDEKSMCLWYALDRWQTIQSLEMEQYDYVIFNRYTLSNVVYQTARRYNAFHQELAEWIFALEHEQLMLPVPDMYIYLDTKEEFSGENVLKKGERAYTQGLDVYEKSQSLLAACHRIYRKLADEIHEIKIVDCMDREGRLRSVEAISAEVLAIVEGHGL